MSSEVLQTQAISSNFEFDRSGKNSVDNGKDKVNPIESLSNSNSIDNDVENLTQDILKPDNKELDKSESQVKQETPEADVDEAISVVSSFINQPPRNVNFIKDDASGKTVIKVFDIESKELIKQFPSEELISIAKKIQELHQEVGEKAGIFIDRKI